MTELLKKANCLKAFDLWHGQAVKSLRLQTEIPERQKKCVINTDSDKVHWLGFFTFSKRFCKF